MKRLLGLLFAGLSLSAALMEAHAQTFNTRIGPTEESLGEGDARAKEDKNASQIKDAPAKNPATGAGIISADTTANKAAATTGAAKGGESAAPAAASVFAPAAASTRAPVASSLPPTAIYRVGVGDVLDVRLLNGVSRESTLFTVSTGGLLDYPLAGEPFLAAGMTADEIAAHLSAELRRRAVNDRAQFRVSVREYVSHTVMVSGLVEQPGAKIMRREAVPLFVVLAEALPRAEAARATIISRSNGLSRTIELIDSPALNELVAAGDVVNVTARQAEYLYIGGQISSPGRKDFHAGLTLTQAILASGGVRFDAKSKVKVVISRQGADGRLVPTEYVLKDIETGKVPDPRLLPGDRIEVGRRR
ncbi:MAG: polysaccharide biosynthesis/export family protein [Pyrinomonadaceae bacterium]|nr:polysaccharide biosynthesis/export family protein [Pyrinomonadaceae bacterium]MDQ3134748.1 polysaccharide biosynthesis/export family protein [Acidobacteriota bacterium]